MTTTWPFGDLRPLSYDVILADPPGRYENWSKAGERKNPTAHYACSPTADLAELPVHQLAAPASWLWMWATPPMLDQALDLMDSWGFSFVTMGSWVKRFALHGAAKPDPEKAARNYEMADKARAALNDG